MDSLQLKFSLLVLFLPSAFLLAQKSGLQPKLFAPELISTPAVEYAATFSPSGKEVYFARSNGSWGAPNTKSAIYYSRKIKGQWSMPVLAPFSGTYSDSGPYLSKDGNSLYFISKRPSDTEQSSADIWIVKKDKQGKWGAPSRLPNPINSPSAEYSPRTDQAGNLYFASIRPEGYGQGDLYMAKLENGEFAAPINLGASINSDKGEWNLEVNEAGDMIIFEASERELNISGYGDLYITFKIDNQWTQPQNIKELNTSGSDLYPLLVKKGRVLYFTSSKSLKSPDTNIYSVRFKSIYRRYKKQAMLN